jgi:hypothetical protein
MGKITILKRGDGDALEHLPELLESIASIVGDGDLSQDEREAMLAQTFDLYREFTGGRDGLADIAATRGSKAEKGIEKMDKVDVGELAQVVLKGAAVALQKREPNLTAEQAYSRVYQDPRYHEAMKAERQASRARLVAGYAVAREDPEVLQTLSDADIKRLISEERRRHPFLSGEALLARVEASPEMREHRAALRQRVAAARRDGSTWMSEGVDKRAAAHDAIAAKAAELRKVMPHLTEEQSYAKAYLDPANRSLAKAERSAARAVLYG